MKIMKVLDKKVSETEYYKYRIALPKEIAEKSGLLEKELQVRLEKDKIIIERV